MNSLLLARASEGGLHRALCSGGDQQMELIVVLLISWAARASPLEGVPSLALSGALQEHCVAAAEMHPDSKKGSQPGLQLGRGVFRAAPAKDGPLSSLQCQQPWWLCRLRKAAVCEMFPLAAAGPGPALRPRAAFSPFRLNTPLQLGMAGWREGGSKESTGSDGKVPPEEPSVRWLSPHSPQHHAGCTSSGGG